MTDDFLFILFDCFFFHFISLLLIRLFIIWVWLSRRSLTINIHCCCVVISLLLYASLYIPVLIQLYLLRSFFLSSHFDHFYFFFVSFVFNIFFLCLCVAVVVNVLFHCCCDLLLRLHSLITYWAHRFGIFPFVNTLESVFVYQSEVFGHYFGRSSVISNNNQSISLIAFL